MASSWWGLNTFSPNKFILVPNFYDKMIELDWWLDCGAENTLKPGDVIQCRECGYRILYKKRTRRSMRTLNFFFFFACWSMVVFCLFLLFWFSSLVGCCCWWCDMSQFQACFLLSIKHLGKFRASCIIAQVLEDWLILLRVSGLDYHSIKRKYCVKSIRRHLIGRAVFMGQFFFSFFFLRRRMRVTYWWQLKWLFHIIYL